MTSTIYNKELKRICKNCQDILNIDKFPQTTTKKSKNISYAYTCKKCRTEKRKNYFKEYHKKNYIKKI